MDEGGPNSGVEEVVVKETAPKPVKPKIAPPEVEYTVDTSGKPYVSPDPRGFVWTPIRYELKEICDWSPLQQNLKEIEAGLRAVCGEEEVSASDMAVIAIPNSDHKIRGGDIIPNLIKQMSAVRAQILRRKPGSGKEFNMHVAHDPWEIKFVLETGEIGDSGDIFKQYRHEKSGRVVVAKLTHDGKLFLPKTPEEWGQLIVEPGA